MSEIPDVQAILDEQRARYRSEKITRITGLELRPLEVETAVDFACDPTPYEDGTITRVRVSVTRFTEYYAVPEGEDRTPFYRAQLYYQPRDRRQRPSWVHAPDEIAQALIGRALTI